MDIELKRIERATLFVTIEGTAPLIVSRFDEKAKQEMLDKQMKKTRTVKAAKDPEQLFMDSMHRFPDGGYGFPVVAFKAATVYAARYFDGIAMTQLRGALIFRGEGKEQLVRLDASEPVRREDMVRIPGTTDIRFRAQYDKWGAVLAIDYLPTMLTADSIVALVDAGGMGGVGEWRPGKAASGSYGTYRVTDQAEEEAA